MNFLQLVQRLRSEAGVSGTMTTVVAQSGEFKRLVDWTNSAYQDIQVDRPYWYWLNASFTFNTVISTNAYAYTADVSIARFSDWDTSSFKAYKVSDGVATEYRLTYIPYQEWRTNYNVGTIASGTPTSFTIKPDQKIAFNVSPDDIYTISGEYYKSPQELALDADIPEMPQQFHMAIVYRSLMLYSRYEAASEIYADAESNYRRFINRIEFNQLPHLPMAGALA